MHGSNACTLLAHLPPLGSRTRSGVHWAHCPLPLSAASVCPLPGTHKKHKSGRLPLGHLPPLGSRTRSGVHWAHCPLPLSAASVCPLPGTHRKHKTTPRLPLAGTSRSRGRLPLGTGAALGRGPGAAPGEEFNPLQPRAPLPNQIDTIHCTENTDPEVAHRTATTSFTSLPTGRTGGPRAGGARAGHWAAHRGGPCLPTGRTRRPRGGARAAGHWAAHRGGPCQEVCRRRTTGRARTTSRATGRLATATPATRAPPVAATDVAKLWEAPERSHQADHDVPGVLHTPSGHHQALDLAGGCWHSVTQDVDAYA